MLGLECTQQLCSKGARLHLELAAKFGIIIPLVLASSCERWKSEGGHWRLRFPEHSPLSLLLEAIKVKPGLQCRPQDVGAINAIGHPFTRENCRQVHCPKRIYVLQKSELEGLRVSKCFGTQRAQSRTSQKERGSKLKMKRKALQQTPSKFKEPED